MLSEIKQKVNNHKNDILLIILVILISLFSFASGLIMADYLQEESIEIKNPEKNL